MLGLGGLGGFFPGQVPGGSGHFSGAARGAAGGGMTPNMASLLVGGGQALLPYAAQGAGWIADKFSRTDPVDFSARNKRIGELEADEDAMLKDEIRRIMQASGRATGGELAASQGAGFTGMSPISFLRAQQGEVLAEQAASPLRQMQTQIEMQRFADEQDRVRKEIERILSTHEGATKRSQVLDAYSKAARTPAQSELYKAAAV